MMPAKLLDATPYPLGKRFEESDRLGIRFSLKRSQALLKI
jgi:hypothetical protein